MALRARGPSVELLHPRGRGPHEAEEAEEVKRYVRSFEHLAEALGFVRFEVGGRETRVELNRELSSKGITFEVPRGSLLAAVRYQVFDDLLIGNFMKTTLHGDFGRSGLYPDFSPYVAKYGDNGRSRTREELKRYVAEYRRRDPVGYLRSRFEARSVLPLQEHLSRALREHVGASSPVFRAAKGAYWAARRLAG
jgi:hypothetical protein